MEARRRTEHVVARHHHDERTQSRGATAVRATAPLLVLRHPRAQQLAGTALADQSRQHLAETALLGGITNNAQLEQLGDALLCHGWDGLVQATWRMAADALTSQLPA
jgi:hypothetical protein